MSTEILNNRHDIYLLFDVTNGNPNGDPDAGNMPRLEPNTNRGIVTDVCLKRKIRNFIETFPVERNGNAFGVFVKSGPALERTITQAVEEGGGTAEEAVKWLCREFYDIRAFGGVLSVGDKVMKGSAYGQVRGPVQFTFAQSFDPISPLDITITRLVATAIADEAKERTMGGKFVVPYGLYAAKIFVSPAFAERTGFTLRDLEVFFEALNNMFEHDRSAARGDMVVRGIYDFEHVGTQHENNAEANKREARLGCCHANTLFEGIEVRLNDGIETPASFADYTVRNIWDETGLPAGVRLHKHHR
ncbi:MAG: type I-C CRISPR-associated protein Cas7/Csd2 [Pyrinomonadaceae bacterium]